MGIDTKALLRGRVEVMQIANDLIELYGTEGDKVSINFTFDAGFFKISFYHKDRPKFGTNFEEARAWNGKNIRSMCVFYNCKSDYASVTTDECTMLSLGCWGESVEIMESLLCKYGGWIMRNDCTDEWEVFEAA
jgi:hypothetical protein